MTFDVEAVRAQFPILQERDGVEPLVYLDNAATTQKPQCVIDALVEYYSTCNSNVHRGAHRLADEATRRYEGARDIVASFIGASVREEIIWTAGTTESINIIANGMAQRLQPGDQVLVTELEHHANLVPWQQACLRSGATLVVSPILSTGELDMAAFRENLSEKTRFVSVAHVSNALGTVNPVEEITRLAHEVGALVLIDGAQGVAHGGVNMQAIGCDFYAFSGHKIFGPTGIGVLWGKQELLAEWPVWQVGGEMIAEVSYQTASWNVLPYRLEAGTPNIAGAIGLGAALSWLQGLDISGMQDHERALMARVDALAADAPWLQMIGKAPNRVGVMSFLVNGGHPADVGFLLDRQGVAIRTGHHCAEPLMNRLGVPGTARASFSIYNRIDEVDALFKALNKVKMMLE